MCCVSGSSWVNIYTTYYLEIAGVVQPFSYSIMITCMGLLGVLFSVFFVRYIDRRIIMLVGTMACGICQWVQAITWSVTPGSTEAGNVVVVSIALFTFLYVAYRESVSSFCRLNSCGGWWSRRSVFDSCRKGKETC